MMIAAAGMSIDNVLAVAAAGQGDMLLVVVGIGLSLPLVVWGSALLAWLMNRLTWIVWLGGGVLGYFAGDMILRDQAVERRSEEHTSELQSRPHLVCRLLLEKKKKKCNVLLVDDRLGKYS